MQAVILIHGIGEQIPMETLDGFVEAVWTKDHDLKNPRQRDLPPGATADPDNLSWAKTDNVSRNFELRRVTTESSKAWRKTDFFEFYWAHMISGTTLGQVRHWFMRLMMRNPFKNVPQNVLMAWSVLWLIPSGLLVYYLFTIFGPQSAEAEPSRWTKYAGIGTLTAGAIAAFVSKILVYKIGDVTRYVDPYPVNIATRQKIREQGIELLNSLHKARDDNGEPVYDRIVIVGHSLGTIIGYDILTHAFGRMNGDFQQLMPDGTEPEIGPQTERAALEEMIEKAINKEIDLDIDAFHTQQNKALKELQAQGHVWRVTDFITLGSPLTHAEFLLAKDKADLQTKKEKRLYPTCPPVLEYDDKFKGFSFTYKKGALEDKYKEKLRAKKIKVKDMDPYFDDRAAPRQPHHAALFGYTRWSNLYSPVKNILWGDQISGPLKAAFGLQAKPGLTLSGIRDIAVMPKREDDGKTVAGGKPPFMAHVKYWTMKLSKKDQSTATPHHIQMLRDVLDLDKG
ncbi:MAG: hypothetical protein ABJN22_12085 [Litorimonas sp.]